MSDIWKDPAVKNALKEGRSPDDIAVLECPKCGQWRYYNQGTHFYCHKCKKAWYCCGEDEPAPEDGRPWLRLDGFTTLADTVTVTTEGYDNETLPP